MSRWKSKYESQQLNQLIQKRLRTLEEIKIDGMEPEGLADYSRLLKGLKIIEARIAALDPELFGLNMFDNIPGWINAAQSQIVIETRAIHCHRMLLPG